MAAYVAAISTPQFLFTFSGLGHFEVRVSQPNKLGHVRDPTELVRQVVEDPGHDSGPLGRILAGFLDEPLRIFDALEF